MSQYSVLKKVEIYELRTAYMPASLSRQFYTEHIDYPNLNPFSNASLSNSSDSYYDSYPPPVNLVYAYTIVGQPLQIPHRLAHEYNEQEQTRMEKRVLTTPFIGTNVLNHKPGDIV